MLAQDAQQIVGAVARWAARCRLRAPQTAMRLCTFMTGLTTVWSLSGESAIAQGPPAQRLRITPGFRRFRAT